MKRFLLPALTLLFVAQLSAQNTIQQDTAYDRSKMKLWTCKSVNEENWTPVGVTNTIKLGECITLFFESQNKINNMTMRWKLYKVQADGKQVFINQHDHNTVLPQWRRKYYEECDDIKKKGKYRIYFMIKDEAEAYYGVINDGYFASADFTVE